MNLHDIQRLQADGFLAADQRDRIVAHYKLQDGQSKFVVILSIIIQLLRWMEKGVDIGGIAEPVTTLQWALYYQAVAIATDWWQSNNK
jgi:hypothetical protein